MGGSFVCQRLPVRTTTCCCTLYVVPHSIPSRLALLTEIQRHPSRVLRELAKRMCMKMDGQPTGPKIGCCRRHKWTCTPLMKLTAGSYQNDAASKSHTSAHVDPPSRCAVRTEQITIDRNGIKSLVEEKRMAPTINIERILVYMN